ncbi:hypothetical protein G6F22_019867 [Rhizopus arrhizus]|nr:hypothetical protein G6F22_019867 [Rhizopus arrhizus]
MPFGRTSSRVTWPTGSGSPATSRTASAIANRRGGSNARRSSMAVPTPFSRAAARSRALPARISPAFTSSAWAIASSRERRAALSRPATTRAASRQARACGSIPLIGVSFNPVMAAPGRHGEQRCHRSCSRAGPGCRANGGRRSCAHHRPRTG